MDTRLLFSIIVPVYNDEKYLRICLDSILNQTVADFELIIVNDGSTDGSEEICLEYTKNDPRIQYIKISNSGVSVARNKGIELASGEYLLFCDSDDYWSPHLLETIQPYAVAGEFDVINFGHVVDRYENDVLIGSLTRGVPENIIISSDEWKEKFRYYWNSDIGKLSACEKAFKRSNVEKNAITFHCGQVILEDFEFVIQNWTVADKIIIIDRFLYHIRIDVDGCGILKRSQSNLIPDINYSVHRFEDFLKKKEITSEDFPEKKEFIYGSFMIALERVKSGRGDKSTVIQVIQQLFSNKTFLDNSKNYMGKRLKLLKKMCHLYLYNLAALYIKKIY